MYLKKNKKLLKKAAAFATASAMLTAGAVPAMAEGTSFSEKMKAELAASCENFAEEWNAELAEAEVQMGKNSKVNMTLTLDETGQSMVGMMAGMDASWMKSIGLNMIGAIADGKETFQGDLWLNDSKICSMNILMDFMENVEYFQFPEVSESWMKASLDTLDATVNGEVVSSNSLNAMTGLASNPTVLFPGGEDLSDLLERYGNIVLDHVQDGSSVEEAVSVEGISEDCTMLEGQIYEEDAIATTKDILTTAQNDEQVEALLTKWSEAIPDAGDLNAQFKSFTEEALADLDADNGDTAEEESAEIEYIAFRIWVNGDGEIVGTEVAACTGINEEVTFTIKTPESDDTSALLLDMQADGSGFTVTGTSQKADGVEKGSYSVAVDGITLMDLATESDIAASEEGYPVATCTITFPQGDTQENYNPLSLFSLVLSIDSHKEDNSVNMNLALLSSGAQLGSLSLSVVQTDEAVEVPGEDVLGAAYDVANEEDANAYAEEASYDAIVENIKNAGVPAELVDAVVQSMQAPEVIESEGDLTEVPADAA